MTVMASIMLSKFTLSKEWREHKNDLIIRIIRCYSCYDDDILHHFSHPRVIGGVLMMYDNLESRYGDNYREDMMISYNFC